MCGPSRREDKLTLRLVSGPPFRDHKEGAACSLGSQPAHVPGHWRRPVGTGTWPAAAVTDLCIKAITESVAMAISEKQITIKIL